MSKRRVAITGLGLVTSHGTAVDAVFNALCAGQSGICPITRFDVCDYTTKIAGQISDWDGPPNFEPMERKKARKKLDPFVQYALNAAIDAVNASGLDLANTDPWRCGAIMGTGIGGIAEFEDGHAKLLNRGPSRVSPFMVPKLMCNAAPGNISIHYGIKGPNAAVTSACASAAHAIGEAADCIRHGEAEIMITGGSEAAVTPLGLASFVALRALSTRNDDPQHASRPFDDGRDGFVLSEGAGALVLEEWEHAKARGAPIQAEFLGYGQTADGSHVTAPDEQGAGASRAMIRALDQAQVNQDQLSYINAHGTSTPMGDLAETRAIKATFGDQAKRIPVSSTKSMTGHTLGASGGIETVIITKAIQEGIIPPTINLENPSEGCDLDYVPHTARQAKLTYAMSNSFGFGGHNVSLVIGKV